MMNGGVRCGRPILFALGCDARAQIRLKPEQPSLDRCGRGGLMTTLEAIAFGAMLAWTPSVVILAAALWDVRELEGMD